MIDADSRRWLIVSVHDVAAATEYATRRWMDELTDRGLCVSLLVVPGPWRGQDTIADAPQLCGWLRALGAAGHDIVQHGWSHAVPDASRRGLAVNGYDRVATRGCAEFWHLDESEARRRLVRGTAVLEEMGLSPQGFVPPGWLASQAARSAVVDAGFRFTTTHTAVVDLIAGRQWPAFVLSQRPRSGLAGPGARATVHIANWTVRRGRPLRVAAHPDDLDDPRTRSAVLTACEVALQAGYHSLTYADLVGSPGRRGSVTAPR